MLIRLAAILAVLFIATPVWAQDKTLPPDVQTMIADYQAMMTAQGHFAESLKRHLDLQQQKTDAPPAKPQVMPGLQPAPLPPEPK